MKYLLIAAILLGYPAMAWNQPKLVVGIVIDQMRADYIYRYWANLSDNGFKKIIAEGFECSNTHYNYVPTYTGPGHASIYTGTTPSVHGIIGNDWYTQRGVVYCARDTNFATVGADNLSGQMSPHRLLTTTIGDELRLFSNFRSKIIAVSMKDRGAVFPAGHGGKAYWYDNATYSFITSEYYEKELPEWLVKFNERKPAEKYLKQTWKPLYGIEKYRQSTVDNTRYENPLSRTEGSLPVFNYDLDEISKSHKDLLRKTPFGNSIMKDLALEALKGESLGSDTICDMLFISFSATDYIGHEFGTHAIETEDTYLRLDADIAEILSFLDQNIGRDNFILFLTSDHGGMPNPMFLNDNKLPGGYIYPDSIRNYIKDFCTKNGNEKIYSYFMNDQVWLNDEELKKASIDRKIFTNGLTDHLLKLDIVADVIAGDDLVEKEYNHGTRSMVQHGFNRKRSGDVIIVFEPGYIMPYGGIWPLAGTDHGSPYRYDTHVPLLWLGKDIRHGSSGREIYITDIAATLSGLLRISQPSGSIGKPIIEISVH